MVHKLIACDQGIMASDNKQALSPSWITETQINIFY